MSDSTPDSAADRWVILVVQGTAPSEPKDASLVHTDWKVGGIDAGAR